MTGCVFCEIVAGRLPAAFVHQDEMCVSFLDLRQVRPGHLMIVPRQHIDHFSDMPDDLTVHIIRLAQKLGQRMRQRLHCKRVGLVVDGYGVSHVHLHVIPTEEEHDITSKHYATFEEGKVVFGAGHLPEKSLEAREAMAAQLRD